MKPIKADNVEGRSLLALRAGPMTPGEISARVGASLPRWLIKAGYVLEGDCYYRITEAGRAACPLRNPLAASGVVQPAIYKPETDMSRNNCITSQQVLTAIIEAGPAGCSPKSLIERFNCADQVIYNHILTLSKKQAIYKPEKGCVMGVQFGPGVKEPPRVVVQTASGNTLHASRQTIMAWMGKQPEGTGAVPSAIAQGIGCTEDSTRAVLAGLYAGLKVDRQKVGDDWAYFIGQPKTEAEPACREQIAESAPQSALTAMDAPQPEVVANIVSESDSCAEIVLPGGALAIPSVKAVEDIREMLVPIVPAVVEDIVLDDPDGVEFAIFSSGGLDIYCDETTVTLNKEVLAKLRAFLGLFQEAV